MKLKKSVGMTEIIIICIIVIALIILKIPVKDYTLAGDSVVYTETTESIAKEGAYNYHGEPFNKYPPLYSLFSVPFYYITGNAADAIRFSNMFFGIITIVILFIWSIKIGMSLKDSTIIALLLGLNPFYFYFTTTFAYSDGLAIFLMTAGFFLFYYKDDNQINLFLSAAAFGLSVMARIPFLAFTLPFFALSAYHLFKHIRTKNAIKKIITDRYTYFTLIMAMPVLLWQIRNTILLNQVTASGYSASLGFYKSAYIFAPAYLLLIIPATLLFITPFVYTEFFKLRKRTDFMKLVFYSFLIYISIVLLITLDTNELNIFIDGRFAISSFVAACIAGTRYILPVLPIFTLLTYKRFKVFYTRFHATYPILALLIIFTALINFGQVQNAIAERVNIPETYVQRAEYRAQAIGWLNEDAQKYSKVSYSISEPGANAMMGTSELFAIQFRKDIIAEEYVSTAGQSLTDSDYLLLQDCRPTSDDLKKVKEIGHNKICIYKIINS